ncbi:TRAP transporter small permease [Paenibacillus sp. IB182496]|uniref:TRAP transporter small permease n=1 Tax=Paenibacillus sabuli TaxID=2772509 RepID=A0A927BR12_9BACL|nr:TRAP transporter small permease [Paenibacillus sabuli]MBD2844175.1 TRAP transporter small permease [Paenibacillus sabuli]
MRKGLHYIGYTLEFLTCLFLSATVLLTLIQVVYRFVLSMPLPWSQEVIMISFVWFVLFGAALSVKHKEHLKVELLDKAPPVVKRSLQAIELLVVFVFVLVFVYYGFLLVRDNLASGQQIGFLPIKVAYVYAALPISGLFMLYYAVKGLIVK